MSEQNSKQSNDAPRPKRRSRFTLVLHAVGIGLLIGLLITLVQLPQHPQFDAFFLGLDQMRTPLLIIGIALIAGVVALIWYRPRWRTVFVGAAVLAVLLLGLRFLVRIESYYGGMIPRFAWRWAPTAEQQFAEYLAKKGQNESPRAVALNAGEHSFSSFLGANRDGIIANVKLETDWSSRPPRELWRHPVGLGWGGFAIVGQAAITQEQRGPNEAVVCYDLKSGIELWVHTAPARFVDEHGDGPRANPTVVAGRVYAIGATGLLSCLDAKNGRPIWQRETLSDPETQNLLWGMSGSPLVVDDLVIVTPGGGSGRSLVAYRAEDGEQLFCGGDDPAAYASPAMVRLAGQKQILSFNGAGLRGFDENGNPLWLHPWITQGETQRVNVAQPLVVQGFEPTDDDVGHVLISSGYGMGTALLRISREHGSWRADEVWRSRQLKSKMSNFILHDGFIYGLDNGILTCLDVQTGTRTWKQGRYGHGQLLLVGDVLLVQAESGEVALVDANPQEYREFSRFTALTDKTWNNAALAGKILVVRNDREAAAFELPFQEASDSRGSSRDNPSVLTGK